MEIVGFITGFIISLIIVLISISGVGLNKKLSKIHSKFCITIFSIAFIYFFYSLFYDEGKWMLLIPHFIAMACVLLSLILWGIKFMKKSKNTKEE